MDLIKTKLGDRVSLSVSSSEKEHLNTANAASYLGVSKSTIYKMVFNRRIPFYKPSGKLLYFLKSDLDKYISSNRTPARTENQLLTPTIKTTTTNE